MRRVPDRISGRACQLTGHPAGAAECRRVADRRQYDEDQDQQPVGEPTADRAPPVRREVAENGAQAEQYDAFGSLSAGVIPVGGQGAAFIAASTAFVVDIAVSVAVSLATRPKPASELVGLVYSETPVEQRTDPHEASYPWYRRTVPLAGLALAMVVVLNLAF